jgi:Na+-transporting NADH:ubiquinone oxidoreductase subunit A
VVQAIVIDRDPIDEPSREFSVFALDAIESLNRKDLIEHILEGGLWWTLRELPFRNIPDPQSRPPSIIVALDALEPFQASPDVYLRDQEDLLAIGLTILRTLADGKVIVSATHQSVFLKEHFGRYLTHLIDGHYPAGDPATVLYHLKRSAEENHAWFITGQDLLLLAEFFTRGRYPTQRVVAVGGSAAPVRHHCRTRLGAPLSHLLSKKPLQEETAFIVGGLMRGYASSMEGFMGLYETSLSLIPRGQQAEFLTLFKPGLDKPTYSRTFLSRLNPGPLVFNCNKSGEERACIACMHCADVCPVDILPQMAYKAILAEEVEEYLEHGLLDCVECGLCSYVCPSKIELAKTFIDTKAAYAKEQSE